jgi:prephenate dehydratase
MVYPGVDLDSINNISSHPMALLQCKDFLKKANKIIVEDLDTAQVAKKIRDNKLIDTAAIAGYEAAEIYGLEIIKTNIQTIKDNETRFVVVSKNSEKTITKELNKASLKFVLSHKNGSLANILAIMANYELNLTKIQSIPIIETPWKYSFFIDTTFSNFNKYKEAIKKVSLESELVKEFGVYKNFKSL